MESTTKMILIGILFLITTSSYCQTEIAKSRLEISYGISVNDVYDQVNERDFLKRVSPILIALSVYNPLGTDASIKLDLEYSHKGPFEYDINYLTFSPLYNQQLFNQSIYLEVGPYFGSLFQYKTNNRIVKHEELKKYDVGVQFGFGKNFCLGKSQMSISYQAEVGLTQFSFSKHFVQQFKIGISI